MSQRCKGRSVSRTLPPSPTCYPRAGVLSALCTALLDLAFPLGKDTHVWLPSLSLLSLRACLGLASPAPGPRLVSEEGAQPSWV